MAAYWSYILAPFGLAGMWMAGRRNRWGWALSICTQILWLTYAVQTQQWGFIPGSLAYGAVYARNFIRWAKPSDGDQPGPDTTQAADRGPYCKLCRDYGCPNPHTDRSNTETF